MTFDSLFVKSQTIFIFPNIAHASSMLSSHMYSLPNKNNLKIVVCIHK